MIKFNPFKRDHWSAPVGQGVVAGLMEVCYIALVAIFMIGTQTFLVTVDPWAAVFGIIAFLSLLVLSVAVSGVIIFGWPARYFLEKKFSEALASFIGVVGAMFVIFAIIFIGLAIVAAF